VLRKENLHRKNLVSERLTLDVGMFLSKPS
jgi:hypothetical protein